MKHPAPVFLDQRAALSPNPAIDSRASSPGLLLARTSLAHPQVHTETGREYSRKAPCSQSRIVRGITEHPHRELQAGRCCEERPEISGTPRQSTVRNTVCCHVGFGLVAAVLRCTCLGQTLRAGLTRMSRLTSYVVAREPVLLREMWPCIPVDPSRTNSNSGQLSLALVEHFVLGLTREASGVLKIRNGACHVGCPPRVRSLTQLAESKMGLGRRTRRLRSMDCLDNDHPSLSRATDLSTVVNDDSKVAVASADVTVAIRT